MALKGDRHVLQDTIQFDINEAAAKGVLVCVDTVGSGADFSETASRCTVKAWASGGKPIGVLLTDSVSLDTTKYHVNFQKDEIAFPDKVNIMRKGWCVTNKVVGTPGTFDTAYLGDSGNFVATQQSNNEIINPTVGRFLTKKDSDGYIKVEVNLP